MKIVLIAKNRKYRKIHTANNIDIVKKILPKNCHKLDKYIFFVKHLATLPLGIRLIHISPSYWTVYRSFEIILEVERTPTSKDIFDSGHLQHERERSVMERKYMNSDKAQWKELELTTLINEVGGGPNIHSKQAHLLQCKS